MEQYEKYEERKILSNDVQTSIIEGEKLTNKFRNRGLTRDKRATISSVLDNRTLIILRKLKDNIYNDIYGVISAGKEAYVFNSLKYIKDEELISLKDIFINHLKKIYKENVNVNININNNINGNIIYNQMKNIHDQCNDVDNDMCQDFESDINDYEQSEDTHSYNNDEYNNELYNKNKKKDEIGDDTDGCDDNEDDYIYNYRYNNNDDEKENGCKKEDTLLEEKKESNNTYNETFDIIKEMNDIWLYDNNNNKKKRISHIINILDETKEKKGIALATKVYNTSILVFKKRSQYIEGEFRFRNAYTKNTNPRKMVKQWAEKEFRNLRRILICGLRCPYPLVLRSNVIVMSMIGYIDNACPKMKDLNFDILKWKELYIECICILRLLFFNCKLVHADFSEYNLLYFCNHIYIIDVSQSMEHDHPYSLEFLKRDCLNITNFFKKKIGTIVQQTQQTNLYMKSNEEKMENKLHVEINGVQQKNTTGHVEGNNITSYGDPCDIDPCDIDPCDIIPCDDKTKNICPQNDLSKLFNFPDSQFYEYVGILPLKVLFDFIVSSSLPDDIVYFLENDKKKISLNPYEIIYLQIFGLIKNTTPIAKLNLKKIQKNRIYFEKLKRATCYYVTKFISEKKKKLEKYSKKNSQKYAHRDEVEEQVFLSSWIPSYLNEIKDIRTIEKDLKLLKKGKSIVNNFLSKHSDDENKKKEKKEIYKKNEVHIDSPIFCEEINQMDVNKINDTLYISNENIFEENIKQYDDEYKETNQEEIIIEQDKNEVNEIVSNSNTLLNIIQTNSCDDISKSKDSDTSIIDDESDSCEKSEDEENNSNVDEEEEEEEVKFKGIIPDGITRKEWSKLVKEQNREKRKHKIPKYQKKKKKKKAHIKKKK
ncbi:serine/threonine protein kinase RIO1, putative [Plasmodium sp. gorilla clade G2]|uniref:serine/threonine protein kinase RIO1, putative n=1 Tax=Plasmodium sp. gorilla clade G2 TaxID=880535 RepID=UPI000D2093A4|nr:serine/threonine protein kinase RIO1, putative [Plasmodium sp. gorilla clade G2]SOV16956.1 serine/threonine protein kinase RIO1, putative [Plasmodium sp. gorilla clade G2]